MRDAEEADWAVAGDGALEEGAEEVEFSSLPEPVQTDSRDRGPCLYLGPAGQRCNRAALDGGFCASHRPSGGIAGAVRDPARVLAATIAIVALLWPYLHDVVRELLQWINSP
jgi:hypothetical protein